MSSIYKQLLDYTAATITSLSLTGLTGVHKKKLPWDAKLAGKQCVVAVHKENKVEQSTNLAYDAGYGVIVTFFHADNPGKLDADEDAFYQWRQDTIAAFINQPITSITPQVYQVTVEPGPVIDSGAWKQNKTAQQFVLRFWIRHNRPGT